RQVVAGSEALTAAEMVALADRLRDQNQITEARRVYYVALPKAPPELHDDLQVKLALATYKDPGLPLDSRLQKAEKLLLDVLARSQNMPVRQRQEILGLLGAVYKQRWSTYAHRDDLEQAVYYYRLGYQLGVSSDLGYTAINTAYVLDLLADAEY